MAGGAIGLERSHRGRPAGFRTHALVCLASALLMLVTTLPEASIALPAPEAVRTDPLRMAQGIMTGIGFLGAGVIFRDGLSVRGLTTAASIWITSAIGILVGIGLHALALAATLLTLLVLSVFHRIEMRLPSQVYAHVQVGFRRDEVMDEPALRELLAAHRFQVVSVSHRLAPERGAPAHFEYRLVVLTRAPQQLSALATTLRALPRVVSFGIAPTIDQAVAG
ncbi:MgtC/SapB family protein [Piscinibacter sakaiensis]|uniref:MgtC/SapB family protein n=1 Tax=Piscinibacter sakaiensis TaxID=1547922 RepID=UPI003726E495